MAESLNIVSVPVIHEIGTLKIEDGEHLVGSFIGDAAGPTLVIIAGIHGNEPGGVLAMEKMLPKLEKLTATLKGRLYLLAGNTRALNQNVRFIDQDLNRHWSVENVTRNSSGSQISTKRIEDQEQKELLEILNPIFSTATDEIYALDLHSTSAESTPFAMIGDTLRNRDFARKFPATILLGIEEQLDSTILEYINNLGAITLGFEAGQHVSESTIERHEALIWLALVNSGVLESSAIPVKQYVDTLTEATGSSRLIEVRYRHGISPADEFKMGLGYENFQPVRKNEVLGSDIRRNVKAIENGLILMPLYQSQGEDGFFLGREISPFWLRLSRILRLLRLGGLMHILPGVKKDPADPETLIVNTTIARMLPLQIFHLLGFRKRRWQNDQLVVSRRKHDTVSPFKKR